MDDLFQEKVFGTNNWLLRNRLAVSFEFCSSLILGKFPYKDVRGPYAEFDVFFQRKSIARETAAVGQTGTYPARHAPNQSPKPDLRDAIPFLLQCHAQFLNSGRLTLTLS